MPSRTRSAFFSSMRRREDSARVVSLSRYLERRTLIPDRASLRRDSRAISCGVSASLHRGYSPMLPIAAAFAVRSRRDARGRRRLPRARACRAHGRGRWVGRGPGAGDLHHRARRLPHHLRARQGGRRFGEDGTALGQVVAREWQAQGERRRRQALRPGRWGSDTQAT